ncbi:MAG: GDP-mannose 4,6-dehydratase, partial [Proteobacteria bacterium]|nr:GDP-mannose 4,6-dehydratase [Pseudomonadota bacterium]
MKALITGITGQCGSYMAEILLGKGYEVHGLIRRISNPNTENITDIIDKIYLHHGDMTDGISIHNIINEILPVEIYNFAAMSQVRVSYDTPTSVFDINTLGLIRIMESVRNLKIDCKIYQACSSEMF